MGRERVGVMMNNLAEFLVEITEKSLDRIEEEEWRAVRSLEGRETDQLGEIDKAWNELDLLSCEVKSLLTADRRSVIRSRADPFAPHGAPPLHSTTG